MNEFLSKSRVSSRNKRSTTGILAKHPGLVKIAILLCMAIFTGASIVGMYPPKAVPVAAPQTEFSSGRAMIHLRHISQQAHPLGSAEHDRVRDYILTELTTLGANPEVQSSPVQNSDLTTVPQPLIVQNIVARVKGRGDRAKTVLLSAHYDTVANSPGANDNSSNSSGSLPILGSAVLAATICLGIHLWFKRRVNANDLTLGGLLFWLLLMNITALYLPGANHLFTWPLLFSLFPIGYLVASKNRGEQYNESPGFIALLCVCAMPGIFLFVPLTCALYFAMGLSSPAILMAPQILLITSLFPQLNVMTR